jgi:hypothetical protein
LECVRHHKVPEWCQACGINEVGNESSKKYWQARVVKKALHSVVEGEKTIINVMEQEKAVIKAEKTETGRRKAKVPIMQPEKAIVKAKKTRKRKKESSEAIVPESATIQ